VVLFECLRFGLYRYLTFATWQLIVDFYNETYRERYGGDVSDASLTMLWSLTTALFIPGGMIGSLLGGWLADVIGR